MIDRVNFEGPMSDEAWSILERWYNCSDTRRIGDTCRYCAIGGHTYSYLADEDDWSCSSSNFN